ncbi:MAG: D-Ala-D-Ala carboxypeptidase family metallohydrolase [Myxococcales bacterium]|nr:D-Ala-D-Ala carboxypeptidase family metallohydrolase [Polyangiaceae bacterium]MDW8250308.1 D-Ala-D-Ala carboxypeptidase family metallohydrolase [Myxococcales bacterium]
MNNKHKNSQGWRQGAACAVAMALVGTTIPACQSAYPMEDAPIVEGEEIGHIRSEVNVAGCTCPTKGNCAALSYSDKPADGIYYITSYGGGNETQPQACPGMPMADGKWAYIANLARFGCGTKVKIEANGKSCIAQVADCGPNRCVEDAASFNNCKTHFPIIDASPLITKYLYGSTSAGWSDKWKVKVTEVAASTPIGCPGGGSEGSGGSGGGSGGSSGGSSGTSGKTGSGGSSNQCEKDSDCGGGNAKCDKSSSPFRCVTRKELGESCSTDQECHGGLSGTQRICHKGVCSDACRGNNDNFDCLAPSTCEIPQGQQIGKCKTEGCILEYPSVSILGIPTPARVSYSYTSRGCSEAPSCVIDINNILDAKTRQKLSYKTVKLSPNFSLSELTHQSAASSPYVYVDPEFVRRLQATRDSYGAPMHVNSGYRSPIHQNKVCMGMCGKPSCPGTCAQCSNHMGGQAVDLQHSSPKCSLAKKSCNPGEMHLIFNEKAGGDHLHIDIGPNNPVCSYKAISCP